MFFFFFLSQQNTDTIAGIDMPGESGVRSISYPAELHTVPRKGQAEAVGRDWSGRRTQSPLVSSQPQSGTWMRQGKFYSLL